MSEMTDERKFCKRSERNFSRISSWTSQKVHEKFEFEWNFIIIFPRSIIEVSFLSILLVGNFLTRFFIQKRFLMLFKIISNFWFNGKSFETNFYFLMYFQHVIVIRSDPQESYNVYVRKEWLDINKRDLMSHLVSVSINRKDFLFNAFIDVIVFSLSQKSRESSAWTCNKIQRQIHISTIQQKWNQKQKMVS